MDISASNILDGNVQEIDCEASFANIAVDVENGNYIYSNIQKEREVYQDTLEDIEKTLGVVPDFMMVFPKGKLVQDWLSWKKVGEIDLERARYLLNTDEMFKEMLGETHG